MRVIGCRADKAYRSAMFHLSPRPSTGFAVTLLILSVAATPALSADGVAAPQTAPRVVNVTSDSMPGWLPSKEMEEQARKTAAAFMADMDGGKYAEAYAFIAELDRKDQTLSDFTNRVRQFNSRAGAVVERRIATVTWTKNPAHAPMPGIYAALDTVSRFANIDRHCGYLVLYQAPSEQTFQIMREENNFLDNATAANIAKQSSPAAVDKAWGELSAHCPGYALQAQRPSSGPLPEASAPTIGYSSVNAALAALHSKAGVVFRDQDGWTVAEDAATQTIWSFPPPGNPAYPAAVKRQAVEKMARSTSKCLCSAKPRSRRVTTSSDRLSN